jgi:uncharacterized membrane protein (UPF0127 family)
VRVVRAADEAPVLHAGHGDVAPLGVPVGRGEVAPVHGVERGFLDAAALAAHLHDGSPSVATVSFNASARLRASSALAFACALMLLGGCGDVPAGDTPTSPPPVSQVPLASQLPVGFESVVAIVTPAAGEPCELCVWLADDNDRRSRGLMQVDDLGGRDAMVFVYDRPRTTRFTMRNTVLPLSIAFFDADGEFIEAFDMEPCAAEPCPPYPTPGQFLVAIEVPQGSLDTFGIGAGARLEVLDRECGSADAASL